MTGPRYTEMQKQKNSTSFENSCDPPTSLSVTKYPSTLTHTKCCSYLLIVPTNQQLSQNLKLCMVTLPLSLCLLYSHHVYITYTQYIWTIPKRWVLLTLQPLDHSTIECHGLGDPSHAPCQATWCRSRPSAAPQALAPQAPAPRATARAPQARAQARLERAQPSAPAKRGPLSLMTQITRGYSWLLGWMSCHKVAMYVIYHIHIYIHISIYIILHIIYIYIYYLYIYYIYNIYNYIYIKIHLSHALIFCSARSGSST